MGLADTVTKAYMKENTVFADAFNYLIYGGKTVVNPTQLKELDTTEIALPFGAQNENRTQPDDAVQKYRDVLKSAVIKQDGEAAYILLGIENQTDIHYAMPVRNIIYDALQYGKQVADIASQVIIHIRCNRYFPLKHQKKNWLNGCSFSGINPKNDVLSSMNCAK